MAQIQYDRQNVENSMKWYTNTVDIIRLKCARKPDIYGRWPGRPKGSPVAVPQYPNLSAEMYIPMFMLNINSISKAARVRSSTISRAIEDGWGLNSGQLNRLAAVLHVSVEYLSDPYIATIKISTPNGLAMFARIERLLNETEGLIVPMIGWVKDCYDGLKRGNRIMYADCRFCLNVLLCAKRRPIRESRNIKSEDRSLCLGEYMSCLDVEQM